MGLSLIGGLVVLVLLAFGVHAVYKTYIKPEAKKDNPRE